MLFYLWVFRLVVSDNPITCKHWWFGIDVKPTYKKYVWRIEKHQIRTQWICTLSVTKVEMFLFHMVKKPSFKYIYCLFVWYLLSGKTSFSKTAIPDFTRVHQSIQTLMSKANSNSLTTGMWLSLNMRLYMSLAANFLTTYGILQCLETFLFPTSNSDTNITDALYGRLRE